MIWRSKAGMNINEVKNQKSKVKSKNKKSFREQDIRNMHWLLTILILPYLILLLKNYRSLLKIKTFTITSDPSIFVSVVIACRNEQENLPALLSCISFQDYPVNQFEVIIVDDNSTDDTFKTASEFRGLSNIHALKNKGNGKKCALKTGIESAIGKLIITTDADCNMGKNWIKTISGYYENQESDMIICPVKLESTNNITGKFEELEFLSLQGITAASALTGQSIMCNGANLAFKKEAYLNHAGNLHDEINSGDDVFLLHSLKKEKDSEIKWLESADAAVTTKSSVSFRSLLKQRSRWISKGKYYTDKDTIITAAATFMVVILQLFLFVAILINPSLSISFIVVFILKSIPDFLILWNTAQRYGRAKLIKWFIPAQIFYPFYVLSVVFYSLFNPQSIRFRSR